MSRAYGPNRCRHGHLYATGCPVCATWGTDGRVERDYEEAMKPESIRARLNEQVAEIEPSCERYDWCRSTGEHALHLGPDTTESCFFYVVCERCEERSVRTLILTRWNPGEALVLDVDPTQLIDHADDPLPLNPEVSREDRIAAQFAMQSNRARGRWLFICDQCGNRVRVRHENLEGLAVRLLDAGVSRVTMHGLRLYSR